MLEDEPRYGQQHSREDTGGDQHAARHGGVGQQVGDETDRRGTRCDGDAETHQHADETVALTTVVEPGGTDGDGVQQGVGQQRPAQHDLFVPTAPPQQARGQHGNEGKHQQLDEREQDQWRIEVMT